MKIFNRNVMRSFNFNELNLTQQSNLCIYLGSTPAEVGFKIEREVKAHSTFVMLRYGSLFFDTAELTGRFRMMDRNNYHQLRADSNEMLELQRYPHLYPWLKSSDVFIDGNLPSTSEADGG